ncbi:DNA polymerase III subunit gamma/tau [Parapusillimonas granuli]|uniref:DNA polymerase III subunit gamma/tau n=1 Tax=Parapusillimonas granuli TaxID=380911 RepID=A0A853FRZ5_9BURK|nr:DNA polymerase III subunit gamma/tau [Parapusillimonas granuli]MBB5213799.1 DNA polymerase-3 subunit gamma/tau [Parapusillimonas granuli]NYT48634.1 DNA polymerase III subunit gamma/tau [Parapusillimonas granuli]
MTYLVLARKWRPRSFDTLIGQDHVVRALTHALSTQRLHHAWLFTGTRGVGKTTLSRILAKSLNCEAGITAQPCGVCRACTEIDAGRFVDYVELDAASNRGVEEMTQLLEQAVYAPGSGRFKVYMIDEVHMLTGHAFNAMLKTLEEPPPHVKFILATTDPQKIPVTVLSRCLQFNLKQMTADAIVGHLQDILAQEGVEFETPALRLLAQAASGSMRDALSLTDQAIAYSAGNISSEAIQGMLGTIDQRHLAALLRALAASDARQVLKVADELANRGLSYSGALADLAVLLSRVAMQQRVPGLTPADDPLAEDIAALAGLLHPDYVQLFYSVAVHSRQELALAPDEYAGFVMACLRMLSLVPGGSPAAAPPSPGADASAAAGPGVDAPASTQAAAAPLEASPSRAAHDASSVGNAADHAAAAEGADGDAATKGAAAASAGIAAATSPDIPAADAGSWADHDVPAWEPLPSDGEQAASEEPAAAQPMEPAPESPAPASSPAPDPQGESDSHGGGLDDARFDSDQFDGGQFDDARFEPVYMDEDGGYAPVDDFEALAGYEPDSVPMVFAEPPKKARSPRLRDMSPSGWPALAATLPVTGLAAELARQSEWLGAEGDTVRLRVAVRSLAESPGKARLRTVLSEHFGTVVQLDVEYGATGDETAHAVEQARRAQRQKDAERAVANDAFVRTLIAEFGATVVPGSISAAPEHRAAPQR